MVPHEPGSRVSGAGVKSEGGEDRTIAPYQGFWRELFSRSNVWVSTMAFISLMIAAPFAAVSFGALIYDIFLLGHGLKGNDAAVYLLLGLISASTGGLAASQFSKRTMPEMLGRPPRGGGVKHPPPKLQGE